MKFLLNSLKLSLFFAFILGIPACVTEQEIIVVPAPSTAGESQGPSLPEYKVTSPFSEPIAPETIKAYPHLRGFEGQLLVTAGHQQVVVAGIPPNSADHWMDGILAVFILNKGQWQKLSLFHQIQLKVSRGKYDYFYPIGLTTDQTKDRASLQLVLESKQRRGLRAILNINIYANDLPPVLEISESKEPLGNIALHMRFLPQAAQTRWLRPSPELAEGHGLTAYRHDNIFSFFSTTRGQLNSKTDPMTITFPVSKLSPKIELLLGEAHHRNLLYRLDTSYRSTNCQASTPASCQQPPLKPFSLSFRGSPSDPNLWPRHHLLQFAGKDDIALGYYPLPRSEETLTLELAPNQVTKIFELGESKQERFVLHSTPGESTQVSLAPVKPGQVQIRWQGVGQESVPARIALWRSEDPYSYTGLSSSNPSDNLHINENLYQKGPVNLQTMPGSYTIRIVNEKASILCIQSLKVKEGEQIEVICNASPLVKIENPLLFHPYPASPKISQEKLAALVPDSMWIKGTTEGGDAIASISLWDSAENLNMSLYPLTASALSDWENWYTSGAPRPLKTLLEFREQSAQKALLEVGCTPEAIGLLQWRQSIERIEPDVVQVFGCGTPELERALFSALDEMMGQSRRKKPARIMPASGMDQTYMHSPIYLPRAMGFSTEGHWQERIEAGEYSLTKGVLMSIKGIKDPQGRQGVLDISLKFLKNIQASSLILRYGDKDLKVMALPKGQDSWQNLLALPGNVSGWYRLEVRGQEIGDPLAKEMILASSNYLHP